MLLPIVLLLASASPVQQADHVAASPAPQTSQARTTLQDPGPNSFVHKPLPGAQSPDRGIIAPRAACDEQHRCFCASITAYVFSDGENPQLQYITHCPNRDVPYHTERAHRKLPENEHQPELKRANY